MTTNRPAARFFLAGIASLGLAQCSALRDLDDLNDGLDGAAGTPDVPVCGCPTGYSCDSGCTLGEWYFITTSFASTSTPPRTVRGSAKFNSTNAATVTSWVDSTGASGQNAELYKFTLATDGFLDVTTDIGTFEGQMAPSYDMLILSKTDAPAQSIWLRKGSGLSVGDLQGDYKIVGILGRTSAEWFTSFAGMLTFDSKGCVVPPSAGDPDSSTVWKWTNGAELRIEFQKTCATVDPSGSTSFLNTQSSTASGSYTSTWSGWAGMGGDVLMFSPNDSAGTMTAGTILMVKHKGIGGGVGKLKGSYALSQLVYNPSNDTARVIRGALDLSGSGAIAGGSLRTSDGASLTAQGISYQVKFNGTFASTIKDSDGFVGYQTGLIGNFATANGTSWVLLSHRSASEDPAAHVDTYPSLMIWLRSMTP